MQDLRLIGVSEDGMHLLLGDDAGNRFRLPLDEPLHSAARRGRSRLGAPQEGATGSLRPREVQALVRAGLTAEEVAERAGWSVEKVHRYEGPILAEREHTAALARQVRLRSRGSTHGAGPSLAARVAERLASRHIDAGTARWDARREDRGAWSVVLYFNAGGRQREAAWVFDPLTATVAAADDEARWLSEDDAVEAPGPALPPPTPSAAGGSTRSARVYDVEAEGGLDAPRRRDPGETVDLMAAMRQRSASRGRRRRGKGSEVPGIDIAPEEALPLENLAVPAAQAGMPPPAHTHPEEDAAATRAEGQIPDDARASSPEEPAAELATEPAAEPAAEPADTPDTADGTAYDAPDDTAYDAPDDAYLPEPPEDDRPEGRAAQPRTDQEAEAAPAPAPAPEQAPVRQPAPAKPAGRRSGRPSVPSWDDIVFGRKPQ